MRCRCGGPEYEITNDGELIIGGIAQNGSPLPPRVENWRSLIDDVARRWNVPPALIAGVMSQESGGNPRAKSPIATPAYGLMQVISSTADHEYALVFGQRKHLTEADLFDPELNVLLGAHLLARLMNDNGGNVVHVLASYNRGYVQCGKAAANASPSRWNVVENQGYVDAVLRYMAGAHAAGYTWQPRASSSTNAVSVFAKLVGGALIGVAVVIGAQRAVR